MYEEASEIEYKYDKNNRLKEEKESHPINSMYEKITSYEYDNNGNLLFKGIEEYDGVIEGEEREIELGKGYFENEEYVRYYSYNGRNQLIGMKSDKTEAIYKYDPTGRRESKTVNGKTTTHRWDGSNIVSEEGENPTVYYMGINLIGQKDNTGISYYQYNAHGDITGLENTKTKMLTRYEYDAFGGSKAVPGTVYGYNGQYTDRETGLIYLRNRYYDPETGRFTQEDPVMDGLNWYAYCGNNPVNFVDPMGLWLEGDENLSKAAQLYTTYYGNKWEEAQTKYNRAKAENNEEGMKTAQEEMDNYHALADDIRDKDKNGEVYGEVYDVKCIPQGMESICYACCCMELLSWYDGKTRSIHDAISYAQSSNTESYEKGLGGVVPSHGIGAEGKPDGYITSQIVQIGTPLTIELKAIRENMGNHVALITGAAYAKGHPAIYKLVDSNFIKSSDYKIGTYKEIENYYLKKGLRIESINAPNIEEIKRISYGGFEN